MGIINSEHSLTNQFIAWHPQKSCTVVGVHKLHERRKLAVSTFSLSEKSPELSDTSTEIKTENESYKVEGYLPSKSVDVYPVYESENLRSIRTFLFLKA